MSRSRASWLGLLAGLLLVGIGTIQVVQAHESRPAYLEIEETAPGRYTVLWRTPVLAGMRLPVVLRFPEGIRDLREPLVQGLSDSVLERRWIDAGPQGLAGQRIAFPGLELTITDAVVRAELLDGRSWMAIARPSQPWVELEPTRGMSAIAGDFVRQGIAHILFGLDHLLFVAALMLIVRDRWMLVKTITAFTIAHSITLTLATLGWVSLPAAPVEAMVALSILLVAAEIVRFERGEASLTIRWPWVVAFAFGLLHGFGFAGALLDLGLPQSDVPLALVSFNLGVEIGQLIFIAIVLVTVRLMWRLVPIPRSAVVACAYAIGIVAAFWSLERLDAVFL